MPTDFPLLVKLVAIGVSVGGLVGLILRWRFPHLMARWAAHFATLSWKHYAASAGFFAVMAVTQALLERWSFTGFFSACAVAELLMMFWIMRHRYASMATATPPDNVEPDA